tara:strand:- start:140 stop:1108 length:969 start_codon:yes stop_codon:yes gene_type:complete
MNIKPIIIVSGEPYGVFNEIFLKIKKKHHFRNPILLIGSKNILKNQMNKLKLNFNLNLVDVNLLNNKTLKKINNKYINLIDVNLPLVRKSNSKKIIKEYIGNCFNIGFKIISNYEVAGFINGPVNKKNFLNYKFPGVTEYLAKKFKVKNYAMLIFNKKLSVCPITTHVPLKNVHKHITKDKIIEKIKLVNVFYKNRFNKKPKIAITGFNPHCESPIKNNEEKKLIIPAIKTLKRFKIFLKGPFSTDTLFMKNEIKKFDIVIGMYHDQVLTPIKALYGFNAINLTLGLPFIRISPDHGPNVKMFGKNLSDPTSLFQSIKFLDN